MTDTSAEVVERLASIEESGGGACDLQFTQYAPTLRALASERDALRDQYTYIGKDGKSVLARDLEDERDKLRQQLAEARNALAAIEDMGKDLKGAKLATLKIGLSFLCDTASDALKTTTKGE